MPGKLTITFVNEWPAPTSGGPWAKEYDVFVATFETENRMVYEAKYNETLINATWPLFTVEPALLNDFIAHGPPVYEPPAAKDAQNTIAPIEIKFAFRMALGTQQRELAIVMTRKRFVGTLDDVGDLIREVQVLREKVARLEAVPLAAADDDAGDGAAYNADPRVDALEKQLKEWRATVVNHASAHITLTNTVTALTSENKVLMEAIATIRANVDARNSELDKRITSVVGACDAHKTMIDNVQAALAKPKIKHDAPAKHGEAPKSWTPYKVDLMPMPKAVAEEPAVIAHAPVVAIKM